MQRFPHKICLFVGILAALSLAGCRKNAGGMPKMPPPAVSVTTPIPYPVQPYYEYNGNLESMEIVQVVARVKGFLNEILFTDGDDVGQGDLLFRIDPREYNASVKRAEADLKRAAAEFRRTRSEEERVSRLVKTGAISSEEFEQRVTARETAEAGVMQAEAALEAAQLQYSYTEIRAPISGQISRTLVTRGNLVGNNNESTLLTTIVNMDPLYVYFDVPERDLNEYLRLVQVGAAPDPRKLSLPVEIGVANETGYPHVGVIDFRENRVDMGTGTVRIRGRVPNPRIDGGKMRTLYPGLFSKVRVPIGSPRSMLAIPEDALMTGQEGRFVYVLGDGNTVLKRTVTVGPSIYRAVGNNGHNTDWTLNAAAKDRPTTQPSAMPVTSIVAIENGLKPDDRIVFSGLIKARPGSPVVPEPWELKPPATPNK